MNRIAVCSLLLMTAVLARGADAPEIPLLKPEKLCAPVVTSRLFGSGLAPNNRGGWSFIGQYMNYSSTWDLEKETIPLPNGEHYLAFKDLKIRPESEWVIVDLTSGASKIVRWPGFNAGPSVLAENGRLFFGVDYAQLYYYEPGEDTVKPLGRVCDDRNELRGFYKLILGPDGMIYGSAQTSAGVTVLLQVNPDTLAYKLFRNVGLKGRREGLTYGYYLAVDPPWAYVAVGQGNWELFAVNLETGETKCLADVQGDGCRVTVGKSPEFCSAEIIAQGKKETGFLIDGNLVKREAGKKPDALPMNRKTYPHVAWKNTKAMDISKPPELNAEITGLIDQNGKSVVAWRAAGEGGEWKTVPYAIQTAEPVRIESLLALPDGSIFGNAYSYNGFFRYYPKTRKLDYFGKFGPSRPRLAIVDGKVYFNGYPNTTMYVYDPAKPWTAAIKSAGRGTNDNPRQLGTMGQGCTEAHYCRDLLNGGNGRLYMMGLRERWSTGTGLGFYEPGSSTFFGLGKAHKQVHPVDLLAIPALDRILFAGKPDAGGDARLFVYDRDLNEVDRLEIRPGLADGGALFDSDIATQFFGCVAGPETNRFTLYRYDLPAKKIVRQIDVPAEIDMLVQRQADQSWWALSGDTLYRFDPATLALKPAGRLEGGAGHPVWIGKDLYGNQGGELVRFVVP